MGNDIISRQDLNKQLMKGAGGILGGVGLFILGNAGLPGIILSGLVIIAGIGLSTSKKDHVAGIVAIAAGALGILAKIPFLKSLAVPLLILGGIGLLGAGALSLYKFIKNLQKRT